MGRAAAVAPAAGPAGARLPGAAPGPAPGAQPLLARPLPPLPPALQALPARGRVRPLVRPTVLLSSHFRRPPPWRSSPAAGPGAPLLDGISPSAAVRAVAPGRWRRSTGGRPPTEATGMRRTRTLAAPTTVRRPRHLKRKGMPYLLDRACLRGACIRVCNSR